ncbi:MAG: MFS transporter [Candidatus Caenarcaniphilales bacterium]|nr:MFS transporter [Candidatus Caenarcaniphilales bacterium]
MPSDFKKLLSARFLFTFAVQMQSVILGWRIYELLKDPLYLGLIGLAEAVPAIGFALFAGYLIDRKPPLIIYRSIIFVSLLSALLVLTEHLLHTRTSLNPSLSLQVGLLYSASFLTGIARAFAMPAIFAIIPRLVERDFLLKATAMSSSAMQIARIAGPAIGGLAFGIWGAIASSSIVCFLLLGTAVAAFLIRKKLPSPEQVQKHDSIKDELLSGAKFVFKHPILLPALSLDMISVLFGGVTALLPIFASEILMVGPKGLGVLRAAPAVGATIMSLYLTRNHKARNGFWLLTSVTGFGLCILVFGASTNFFLSLAALALSGAFDSISMVIRSTAVQLLSPEHMRGKISAVNSIFIGSSNEIGEVESGIAAKLLGTVPAVYLGGIVCLITVALTAWLSPCLRKLDLRKLEKHTNS